MITRDSVFVIDRSRNVYQRSDYTPARTLTGLDADLGLLQDLLVGNLHLLLEAEQLEIDEKNANPRVFTGATNGTALAYAIDQQNNKLVRLEAENPEQALHSVITYEDFDPQGKTQMPGTGKIRVLSPNDIRIEFRHSRVEINPERFSTSFKVPDHYERVSN
jgi:hypothetical protein